MFNSVFAGLEGYLVFDGNFNWSATDMSATALNWRTKIMSPLTNYVADANQPFCHQVHVGGLFPSCRRVLLAR